MTRQHKRWRSSRASQERARELRQNQTPAEAVLWGQLRAKQLAGLKFRRQHPIGPFIVDFYCAATKLVVELDGHSHADQQAYDQVRTDRLEQRGYRVIRFTNHEIDESLPAVLEVIVEAWEGEPAVSSERPPLPSPPWLGSHRGEADAASCGEPYRRGQEAVP